MDNHDIKSIIVAILTANNVCIWLNGAVEAERPSWTRIWNVAKKRYCTDGGANRIVGREPELAPPDVVIGDMDSILSVVAEGLKPRCLLVHAPDQDKTDLTKCLEYIAEDFKKGLQLGFSFHTSKASRVLLLGGTSGRFDHSLAAINSLYYSTKIMDKDVYCLDGENLTCVLDEKILPSLPVRDIDRLCCKKISIAAFLRLVDELRLRGRWQPIIEQLSTTSDLDGAD
ncbi:thiamine diphosphokinase [Ancylostoma caninum]|uniref:Thiamine diphosphokinase n=1 Tax=Ancylostoma caninum TaxID=29170 RepID=A0A368GXK2_ANCCA|nr:thiamine diphosphokinase [Ancylostoma caninum]